MTGASRAGDRLPALFDAHFHVVDPRFTLSPNSGYLPSPFTVDDYVVATAGLGVVGGAVVSGSFHGFGQEHLLDALERLGDRFVGVTQLPATVDDEELVRLATAGVRAVRFNLYRGGPDQLDHLDTLARRVHEVVGWHAEVYVDARDLLDLGALLGALPQVCIDHLGLSGDGLPHLLALVERGAKVKATGFGRGDLDVEAAMRAIAHANPAALMTGTDLPSTRARRSFRRDDLRLVRDVVGPAADAVFRANAVDLYRPRQATAVR